MKIEKIEDFVKLIPDEMESILKKVRLLYWELGKRSFYDINFENLLLDQNDFEIYEYKEYSNPNFIICTTLEKQFKKLLDIVGIDSEIIKDEYGHSYLVFRDENGNEHSTDLVRDLKNIQFNCATKHFASSTIDKDKLRSLDTELGLIDNKRGYSDDYWYIIRDKIQNGKYPPAIGLEIILKSLSTFGDLSKLGEIELYNLYRKFIIYCNNGKYNISTDYIVTRQTREYRVIVEDPKTCKTIVNILDLETCRFFNKSNNKKDEFTR